MNQTVAADATPVDRLSRLIAARRPETLLCCCAALTEPQRCGKCLRITDTCPLAAAMVDAF
jgi:hypothetical protein